MFMTFVIPRFASCFRTVVWLSNDFSRCAINNRRGCRTILCECVLWLDRYLRIQQANILPSKWHVDARNIGERCSSTRHVLETRQCPGIYCRNDHTLLGRIIKLHERVGNVSYFCRAVDYRISNRPAGVRSEKNCTCLLCRLP